MVGVCGRGAGRGPVLGLGTLRVSAQGMAQGMVHVKCEQCGVWWGVDARYGAG